ncbi:hypothetical protein E2C01_054329 [Portunus trituberculatus]|uniref:Uncharacterized protein n=1 Tax=Portunus trituberculatus TaxID=210409 RepID=A0A5B7GJ25_PORTR|nr:hypothetical protein [Portunus trituberculatus]
MGKGVSQAAAVVMGEGVNNTMTPHLATLCPYLFDRRNVTPCTHSTLPTPSLFLLPSLSICFTSLPTSVLDPAMSTITTTMSFAFPQARHLSPLLTAPNTPLPYTTTTKALPASSLIYRRQPTIDGLTLTRVQ